jgi:hypothetical protein
MKLLFSFRLAGYLFITVIVLSIFQNCSQAKFEAGSSGSSSTSNQPSSTPTTYLGEEAGIVSQPARDVALSISCTDAVNVVVDSGTLKCPADDMVITAAGDDTGTGMLNKFRCCRMTASLGSTKLPKSVTACEDHPITDVGFYTDCQDNAFLYSLKLAANSFPLSFSCCRIQLGTQFHLSSKNDKEVQLRYAGQTSYCPAEKFVTGLGDQLAPDYHLDQVACSSGVAVLTGF